MKYNQIKKGFRKYRTKPLKMKASRSSGSSLYQERNINGTLKVGHYVVEFTKPRYIVNKVIIK